MSTFRLTIHLLPTREEAVLFHEMNQMYFSRIPTVVLAKEREIFPQPLTLFKRTLSLPYRPAPTKVDYSWVETFACTEIDNSP